MSFQSKLEAYWYKKHWSQKLFLPLHWLLSLVANVKRALYKGGRIETALGSTKVLVVGNLTVGGTGKTPFIAALAKKLTADGIKIGIVSRGYKAKLNKFPHLITGKENVEEIGDEAYMQFRLLKLPMVIGPKRAEAINLLNQHHKLDLIISDDGLQHYQMHRNIELLLVDGKRGFGNGLMLPFGPLREPTSRTQSVDFVLTNGELNNQQYLDATLLKDRLFESQIVVTGLTHILSKERVALSNLKARRVTAVAGIGNPNRFFRSLSPYCNITKKFVFPDHHQFDVTDFENDAELVVMTEKDAVKCEQFARDSWYYLNIEMKIPNSLYDAIVEHLN